MIHQRLTRLPSSSFRLGERRGCRGLAARPSLRGLCFNSAGAGPVLGQNQPLHPLPSQFPPRDRCNGRVQPCSQPPSPAPGWPVVSLGASEAMVPSPWVLGTLPGRVGGGGERDGPGRVGSGDAALGLALPEGS